MIIRSQPSKVFLAKVWLPSLCVALGVLLSASKDFPWRNLLLALPLLAAAAFGVSLAVLEYRDGIFRYRRFLKWNTIHPEDVLRAQIVWSPIIGSLRLRTSIPPWGTLYFVLDANSEANPLRPGRYALLRSLNKHLAQLSSSEETTTAGEKIDRARMLKVIAAFLAGVIFNCITELARVRLFSTPKLSRPAAVHGSVAIQSMWYWLRLLQTTEVVGVLFVLFAVITIIRYRRKGVWIFAFLAGNAFSHVVAQWL
jgi:hypothetical protein